MEHELRNTPTSPRSGKSPAGNLLYALACAHRTMGALYAFFTQRLTTMEPITSSEWRDSQSLLITCLSGNASLIEVETWRIGLYNASDAIPARRRFALLIDFSRYDAGAVDPNVHALVRRVIPAFLEKYDHRISYLKIYHEGGTANALRLGTCAAVAHVHVDCRSAAQLERTFATENERFFCSVAEAEEWLEMYMQQPA